MSKPIRRPWPAARALRTMPTMPPAGPDKIASFPWKRARLGQAARALHEQQAYSRHLLGHLVHIAAQDRREIGIDDGGVAARHQLHQRAHPMRHGDLRKSDARAPAPAACQLVGRGAIGMQEHDGAGANARLVRRAAAAREARPSSSAVTSPPRASTRSSASITCSYSSSGSTMCRVEQPRPRLRRDAQCIAKATGRHQAACARRGARAARWWRRWCPSSRESTAPA